MSSKTSKADIVLPAAVVAVVGMMVFPLPVFVVDTLLMLNIAFALCILISVVYLTQPEKFTSLPTILLLTTLFRLGLNVSTTRQLLGTGEAPEVVSAFGNFVASGNLVVGLVVFSIITLVQFLVIAKGAERVAEVAARFTLDAMPGKQMSIDADVRSGVLSVSDAREKRIELQQESRLYGALDGAMKFVKGDAIAGLLITIVNITAGFIVGVTQQGLSLGEAVNRYSIFTIGDGLVSQIPALLIAVAAGIAVTRVNSKDGSFVGRDILSQLGKEPQAMMTTAVVLLLLAMVPGLPTLSFVILAGVFVLLAEHARFQQGQIQRAKQDSRFQPRVFSPIVFRISSKATSVLQEEKKLTGYLQMLRNDFFERYGVLVPDIQFDLENTSQELRVEVLLHGVPSLEIRGNEGQEFSASIAAAWRSYLDRNLQLLIDDTQTRTLLEVYQPLSEDLINNVVPEIISVTGLTTILRELLLDGIGVKEFPTILQAVAESHLAAESSRLDELLADVRVALSRTISTLVCDGEAEVSALVVSPEVNHILSQTEAAQVVLSPQIAEILIEKVRASAEKRESKLIIVASRKARAPLTKLLREEISGASVIAAEELVPGLKVSVQGELSLADDAEGEPEEIRNKSQELEVAADEEGVSQEASGVYLQ